MVREILKESKILTAYSDIYNCNQVKRDIIIQKIRGVNIRNSLRIIRMLLSDIDTQYYYQKIYWYRYKEYIKNDGYYEKILFSRQGLLYMTKWLLAYGDYTNTKERSKIDDTIELLHIQIMIVDYLDKEEIDPLRYIHKNLYFNSQRNIMNDIARAFYLYNELSQQSNLYDPKEYVDIYSGFVEKYGYTIKDYIFVMFSLYSFHIGKDRYKLINKDNLIKNMNQKEKISTIIDDISQRYCGYAKWARDSIDNSWDYEEFMRYPIMQLCNDEYISLEGNLIVNKFFEALYYKILDIYSGKGERNKVITFLGRPFEKYIEIVTEKSISASCCGYIYVDEFIYGKNNEKSSDAYIILNDSMIIVEAKSTRPVRETFISEDGEKIDQAIEKLYVKPILQANKAYENIMKTSHKIKFSNINKIYIICVSIENIPYIKEVKQKVDLNINANLNDKVKGYCNLNIEEYELLCTMINNNVNVIDIISKYFMEDDPSPLKKYVDNQYLNLKMDFINKNFEQFALEIRKCLFH